MGRRYGWLGVGAALLVLAAVSRAATALPVQGGDIDDIVQTLADLTLIDGQCHELTVNFGIGFNFAAEHGVTPAAVMPTGPMRKAFEVDLHRSVVRYTLETTCGALAAHYSIAVPGSVSFPASSRERGL